MLVCVLRMRKSISRTSLKYNPPHGFQFCSQATVESWELLLEPLINLNQDLVQDTT